MIFDGRATGDSSFTDEIGLPGAFLRHLLERAAPVRQRRDHRVALHVVAGALPDLVLRLGDVVDHVADHDAEPVIVKSAKLHLFSPLETFHPVSS